MESLVGSVMMPGEILIDLNKTANKKEKIVFGPGLRRESEKIIAVKAGVLKRHLGKAYYIDNHQKRYIPSRGECVVGVVMKKGSEEAVIDIGSSEPAILSLFSFEGATKKNKPLIKAGDCVYAKILVACKDIEPELVCVNSYGKSEGLGILSEEGFVFTVSLDYARRLLFPKSPILTRLGNNIPFEIAVGINGRLWVRSKTFKQTMLIVQALCVLQHATLKEVDSMCDQMFDCVTLQ